MIIAIVGHHPHLQQPVINYKGRPIFCSLGNFIFDEPFYLSKIGSVLSLEIENDQVIHYQLKYTKLTEAFQLIPLAENELIIELSRIESIKKEVENNSSKYKNLDKIWIKYLLYQSIRHFSFNDFSYLFNQYSPYQIAKKLLQ